MDIKHLLRTSVDMDWVRSMTNACIGALLLLLLVSLIIGGLEAIVMLGSIGLAVEIPFFIALGRRCWKIFHQPERYRCVQCTLNSLNTPERFSIWGTSAFYVVVEDEDGSKEVVSTNHIFFPGGLRGPQLKDYINRTVTIAYNPATESVVVIG